MQLLRKSYLIASMNYKGYRVAFQERLGRHRQEKSWTETNVKVAVNQ